MKKPSILVVGSMNMDIMIYGVPKIAEFGESVIAKSYLFLPGGKGANQSVAAAKLGADSAMVGRLGDDAHGRQLINNLNSYGVDTEDTILDPKTQTGLAPIMVDEATARYVSYVIMGGNDFISADQVEHALARRHFDMVLMQLEMPLEVVYRTYELASEKGVPVFLDAGPAMDIPLDRLRGIFVISPNEVEAKALTGIMPDTEENAVLAAKKLYEKAHPRYVLLKLGARGALLYDGATAELIPCFDQIKAADSTAAGDTFSAAFAVQHCKGAEIHEVIRFAHAAAGICVSRKGAQASLPSADEVEAFLQTL